MDDDAAWFLGLHKATGFSLTIFYDAYDRGRFLEGFVTTVKLSAYCLVLSLALGALVAMLRFKVGMDWTLLGSAVLGAAWIYARWA